MCQVISEKEHYIYWSSNTIMSFSTRHNGGKGEKGIMHMFKVLTKIV